MLVQLSIFSYYSEAMATLTSTEREPGTDCGMISWTVVSTL